MSDNADIQAAQQAAAARQAEEALAAAQDARLAAAVRAAEAQLAALYGNS